MGWRALWSAGLRFVHQNTAPLLSRIQPTAVCARLTPNALEPPKAGAAPKAGVDCCAPNAGWDGRGGEQQLDQSALLVSTQLQTLLPHTVAHPPTRP